MKDCRGVISTALNLGGFLQLRLGVADDLVARLLGDDLDEDAPVAARLARPGHHHLLLREAHTTELHRKPPQRPWVAAGRVDACPRDLGHRVEPVQDVLREADLLGELRVDMDGIEVSRGARISVGGVLVRRDLELDLHGYVARTMLVQVPRTTSWPCWFVESDSKT